MAMHSRSLHLFTVIGAACAVLVGEPAVSQAGTKRLAVLELKGESIKGEVLDAFADAIRGGAVQGLFGRGVDVITRENMLMLIKEMGKKDCSEGDCEVETARNIGADFVVSGSVAWMDGTFVVTLKLHETKRGSLLATDLIEAREQLAVLRQLPEHARSLVANNVEPNSAQAAVAQERAPAPAATPAPARPAPEPAQALGKRLAVLEFKGAKIDDNVLDNFSDEVRGGVIDGLAGSGVQVITRETMMVLLQGMEKRDRREGDSVIETARNIGADFVVSGSVVRMDDAFVVTLKLHETKRGSLLATDRIEANNQLGVSRQLREHARKLMASIGGPSSGAPPVPSAEAKKHETAAGSVVFDLDYTSLGGSNGVARRGVYAGALHVFFAGFGSDPPIAMNLDVALGGGPGFDYDLDLLLGPGWWFNQTLALAALAGLGIDGITGGTAPFALKTPVRLLLALNLGNSVRIEAKAGFNWLFETSNRRKRGSEAVRAFADEMVAGGRLFIGRRCAANSDEHCGSFAFGFTYQEMLGTRALLFTAGGGGAMDPRIE